MYAYVRQALTLLSEAEKKQLCLILVITAVAGIIQTVSVLALMPLIVLLANPEIVQTNLFGRLQSIFGIDTYHGFLVMFGLIGIVVLSIGNMFVAFERWMSSRFINLLEHRVKTLVLERMMSKPYEYFVTHHSAKLSDIVLKQADRVVDGVIGSFIAIFGGFALALFIVLMLLVISFKTTLVTLLGLVVAFLTIFMLLRRRIESHGAELTRLSARVSTAVRETLDGIREIKSRRAEAFFSRRFAQSSLRMSKLCVRYSVLSFLPYYLLETVVLAGFVAISLYFVFTTADSGTSLAYVALYGIAIYRLIPGLQGIFEGASDLHHNADAVQLLLEHCAETRRERDVRDLPPPRRSIRLENVSYRYRNADCDQFRRFDLDIPAGSSLCLFGPSGAGKTTILNLLAGLIRPQEGSLTCDGVAIGPDSLDAWRRRLGYFPQQIYLFDDSISSNVAFGLEKDGIDHERVREVAVIANLDDFVATLPQGYETIIGEQGETLSGGQRQRLGIARTLYHDPDVLVFDESFTGLDAENRGAILDKLFALEGKTLVFSSHEEMIASRCDRIVVVEQGAAIAAGSYRKLLVESPRFVELLSQLDRKSPRGGESRAAPL